MAEAVNSDWPKWVRICNKNHTVVEYALRTAAKPIGVATYTIVPKLPETLRNELPSPEVIAERLEAWDLKKDPEDGE